VWSGHNNGDPGLHPLRSICRLPDAEYQHTTANAPTTCLPFSMEKRAMTTLISPNPFALSFSPDFEDRYVSSHPAAPEGGSIILSKNGHHPESHDNCYLLHQRYLDQQKHDKPTIRPPPPPQFGNIISLMGHPVPPPDYFPVRRTPQHTGGNLNRVAVSRLPPGRQDIGRGLKLRPYPTNNPRPSAIQTNNWVRGTIPTATRKEANSIMHIIQS